MKPDLEYTFPIPEAYNQLIIEIVTQAEKDGVCVCFYDPFIGGEYYGVGPKSIPTHTLLAHGVFIRLGFLSPVVNPPEKYPCKFIIEEKAFVWVKYSRRSRPVKWVIRKFSNFKDIMLAVSFSLNLLLAVTQLIQAIKK